MSSTTISSFDYRTARPSSSGPRHSTVRLTRRGRAVVFLLALVALVAVGFLGAGIAGAATHRGHLATHAVTVQPGDTLWGLSSKAAHGGDVRAMEQRIQDLNGLSTSTVYLGQHLVVPN